MVETRDAKHAGVSHTPLIRNCAAAKTRQAAAIENATETRY